MGIRFYCPHGHKLNVKVEQAGKVGICPKCGERVLIPMESTRQSSHKKEHTDPISDQDASTAPIAQDEKHSSEQAAFSMEDSAVQEYSSVDEITPSSEMAPPPVLEEPSPFAENSTVPDQWELLTGDQTYGPVSREQFIRWIEEQRISPTMRVRRVGWKEWKVIQNLPEFAEYFIPSPPSNPPAPVSQENTSRHSKTGGGDHTESAPFQLDPDAVFESEQKRRNQDKKRKKRNRDVGLVIGLLAAIIGLLALLLYLLSR